MNKELGAWAQAATRIGALTAAYAPKEEPTIEELKSELDAAQTSHRHANRSLTNMAVALSDSMDHVVALQEEARKTKLEHQKEIAHLNTLGDAERRLLKATEGRLYELDGRLKTAAVDLAAQLKRTEELADLLAARTDEPAGEPLFVTRVHGSGPEWHVASRGKQPDGSRDVIGIFHAEAPARWFAAHWRPEPLKEAP